MHKLFFVLVESMLKEVKLSRAHTYKVFFHVCCLILTKGYKLDSRVGLGTVARQTADSSGGHNPPHLALSTHLCSYMFLYNSNKVKCVNKRDGEMIADSFFVFMLS